MELVVASLAPFGRAKGGEKEGTRPFECYLTVMAMNGHQREAAADVRLMLTKVGFDEVSCTAHSMNVRHDIFAKPCSAKAALVGSLARFHAKVTLSLARFAETLI
jgi:hypothetical protein